MRAADLMVRCLEAHGVTRVYCVPGESYLALLDALYDSSIEVIICRHESGAAFMAVAEAKLTGKPGVVLVSRGPGATNAAIGLHTAEQDGAPLILLVGQVAREERYRGAFQEMDYVKFFGGIAKAVYEVTEGQKLAEILPRSFHLAQQATPGPVVISLPEDMLNDEVTEVEALGPLPMAKIHHGTEDIAQLDHLLFQAERPLVIAGGLLRGSAGATALRRFAEAQRVPVAVTWKNQDIFDNGSALYAGHLGFGNPAAHRDLLAQADLIVAVGTRLGDIASLNYQLPQAPRPKQRLVHIYPDAQVIGKVFATDFGLVAEPAAVLSELAQNAKVVSSARESWCHTVNKFIKEFQQFSPSSPGDGVDFGEVVMALAKLSPPDAIITTDSGNSTSWLHRHWVMGPQNIMLGAIAGAMGFGVPAAVVASLLNPKRMVLSFIGDGSALMTGQELATAQQYGANVKIILSDNGSYGTIRGHQERHYPQRVSGTSLQNPDFTLWAQSFGLTTVKLEHGDDMMAKVDEFLKIPGSALLHVKSSLNSLSAFSQPLTSN